MFDIARVEMARGNKDEAKNLFEALEREHEDFSLNAQVKARLAEFGQQNNHDIPTTGCICRLVA